MNRYRTFVSQDPRYSTAVENVKEANLSLQLAWVIICLAILEAKRTQSFITFQTLQ
jgi:hypothetical protein